MTIGDLASPYIIAVVLGWLVAHATKYLVSKYRNKRHHQPEKPLFTSGGMPSAHTTTVFSLLTVISLVDGIASVLFGLALLFTMIVTYDAMQVRRSVGEQGIAIRKLIKEQKSKIVVPRISLGHKPIEVFFGAVLGIAIGFAVFLAT